MKKSASFVLAGHCCLTISSAFTNVPCLIRHGVKLRGSTYRRGRAARAARSGPGEKGYASSSKTLGAHRLVPVHKCDAHYSLRRGPRWALLEERRVLAPGWAGENDGLFEQPAGRVKIVRNICFCFVNMQNSFSTQDEAAVQRAISSIAQSDPLIKLLQQVRLGRLKSTDTGVRAVTESWLETYEKALATDGLTRSCLRRLNPAPRLAVLIDVGVLADNHPGVESLTAAYDRAVACAPSD